MNNFVRRIGLLVCGVVGAAFAAGTARADLLIQLSPTELSLSPGQCGKVTITSQPQLGFPEGAAKIRYVINRISGVDVIEAKTAGPDFPPVVLLTPVHNAEPGPHSMTITALIYDSAGNQIGDKIFPDAFTLTIEAPPKLPEFSFTIPESVEVTAGQELDVPLALRAEGFQGVLNVQAYPPPGISIDQPKFTISAGEEKMIHVRVAADAPEKGTLEVQAQTSLGGQMILKVFRVQVRVAKPAAAPVPAATLPVNFPAGSRILKNRETGNCLTAENGSRADGTHLVMAPCGSKADLQSFTFGSHGEIHNGEKCAVLYNNGTDDDTPIVLWGCNNGGQGNEMWTLDASSRLIGREFGKCLEPNGSDEPNHAAILRPCRDGNNQKWSLDQPPPPAPAKLARNFPAASGMLQNRSYGTCLTIENNQRGDGTHLVLAPCGSLAEAQAFTFGPNGEIQNGGKCAVLNNNQTSDDTPVVLWGCSNLGNMNETWTFDGSHRLIGREFGKCMEPQGDDTNHAAILRPCRDGGSQKWNVEQPPPPPPAKLAKNFPAASGMLKNFEYGNCLTIENNQHGDGAHLVMAPCGSVPEAQIFTYGPNGEIQNGGKCAVLYNNQTADDTPVVLWGCSNLGNMNETWTLDAYSRLIGREFGKCLEPQGGDSNHAAILRPCWDGNNQKWSVAPPPPAKLARNFPAASGMLKNGEYGNCLTIENNQRGDGTHLVMAACGSLPDAQTFTFGPNGEIQNGGKCAVLSANQTADDTPVVLWGCSNNGNMNETWTFDGSSRLIGREFGKCLEPNGSDDPNHAAILRPCWDGNNQKWRVEQPPAPQVAAAAEAVFELKITPDQVAMKSGQSMTIEVLAKLAAGKESPIYDRTPLHVSVQVVGGRSVTIDPGDFSMQARVFGQREFRNVRLTAVEPGASTIRITGVGPDGAPHATDVAVSVAGGVVTVAEPVAVVSRPGGIRKPGGDPGGVPLDTPDLPDQPPEPAAPLDFSTYAGAAQGLRAQNVYLEGLAGALERNGPMLEDNADAQLIAVLKAYEATTRILANPANFAVRENVPLDSFDPALMARMIDEAHARGLKPSYQIASIATLPIFMEDAKQLVNWQMYNTIELVIENLKRARAAGTLADITGVINRLCDAFQLKINSLPPGVDLAPPLKAIGAFGAGMALADSMVKAYIALMPNRVTNLYTVIKGQNRGVIVGPPPPAIDIKVGERADLKVFIVTQSKGGQVITPLGAVNMIVDRITKMDKYQKWLAKLPAGNAAKLNLGKDLLDGFNKYFGIVWSPLTAWGLDPFADRWNLPVTKSRPIEVDSTSVLDMAVICRVEGQITETCPQKRIEIGTTPTGVRTSAFYIDGKSAGLGGYRFGLKPALFAQILAEEGLGPEVKYSRLAEVNVEGGQLSPCYPKPTPANYRHGCQYENGKLIVSPLIGVSPGFIGYIDCDGRCQL